MLLSKCALCDTKKMKFLEKQEARALLGHLTGVISK